MRLSNEELALLSTYVYLPLKNTVGRSLGKLIEKTKSNEEAYQKVIKLAGGNMDKEAYVKQVLDAIQKNEKLSQMSIMFDNSQERGYDSEGLKVIGLRDVKTKEAVFVYRGTNSGEWIDNGIGLYQAESPQQIEAREYFENKCVELKLKENEYQLIVTGHSKGGNKAMYINIVTGQADRCVAFDGQGFSNEFIEKYSKQIEDNIHKMELIAADKDYVHCLGNMVVQEENLTFYKSVKGIPFSHAPNAYLTEDGHFTELVKERPKLSKSINSITKDIMKAPDREKYLLSVMGACQLFLGKNTTPVKREHMPNAKQISSGIVEALNYCHKMNHKSLLTVMAKLPFLINLIHKVVHYKQKKIDSKIDPAKVHQSITIKFNNEIAVYELKNQPGKAFIGKQNGDCITKISDIQSIGYLKKQIIEAKSKGINTELCLNEFVFDSQKEVREMFIALNARRQTETIIQFSQNDEVIDRMKLISLKLNEHINSLQKEFQTKDVNLEEEYYHNYIRYMDNQIKNQNISYIDKMGKIEEEIQEILSDNIEVISGQFGDIYYEVNNQYMKCNEKLNQEMNFYITNNNEFQSNIAELLKNDGFPKDIKETLKNIQGQLEENSLMESELQRQVFSKEKVEKCKHLVQKLQRSKMNNVSQNCNELQSIIKEKGINSIQGIKMLCKIVKMVDLLKQTDHSSKSPIKAVMER